MKTSDSSLWTELRDERYRHAYVDEFLHTSIATQIRALREDRGWTQQELADKADMKQARISLLENVNYSAWNIKTLGKLAKAFDVALVVKFESFARRIADIEAFNRDSLVVPSFEHDQDIAWASLQPGLAGIQTLQEEVTKFLQELQNPVRVPNHPFTLPISNEGDEQIAKLAEPPLELAA